MNLENLRTMYEEQLKDICSAEQQLTEALPKMHEAATAPELKAALQEHLEATKVHLKRVQDLMAAANITLGNKKCAAMEGLVKEGGEIAKMKGDTTARDAGIIGAAQKVEHYEIATYGTLRAWAETLGEKKAANVLRTTLDEEYKADKVLNAIAEGHLNAEAAS